MPFENLALIHIHKRKIPCFKLHWTSNHCISTKFEILLKISTILAKGGFLILVVMGCSYLSSSFWISVASDQEHVTIHLVSDFNVPPHSSSSHMVWLQCLDSSSSCWSALWGHNCTGSNNSILLLISYMSGRMAQT